jgi:hypothetical protein
MIMSVTTGCEAGNHDDSVSVVACEIEDVVAKTSPTSVLLNNDFILNPLSVIGKISADSSSAQTTKTAL